MQPEQILAGLGHYIRRVVLGIAVVTAAVVGPASALATSPTPAWHLAVFSQPTNFPSGASVAADSTRYFLVATNVGGEEAAGPITLSDTVPPGVTPVSVHGSDSEENSIPCEVDGRSVTCTDPGPLRSGGHFNVKIGVDVDPLPEGTIITDEAAVGGGGAPVVEASTTTTISSTPASFGFLPAANGLSSLLTEADGSLTTQAGSHPYQLTLGLGFPSKRNGEAVDSPFGGAGGGLRDVRLHVPRGLVVDPGATPVRCTEIELEGVGCPLASAIGVVSTVTTLPASPTLEIDPLYNMVPPPSTATAFGFNAGGAGIFIHLLGGVRSGGDFALSIRVNDLLARSGSPILGIQAQLWGDPSSASHDRVRGPCLYTSGTCPVPSQTTAFLTSPGECSAAPLITAASADSWEAPGVFQERSYEHVDRDGERVAMVGCGQLEFEPEVELRPTTSVADSPSGLQFSLRQPQSSALDTRAPASLKDIVATLPAGLTVNPAGANGRRACGDPSGGSGCPDAAKIGAVEVDTPLLDEPLPGSVYLARPFDNPFGALIALYLVIDDPKSGIVAMLPGAVRLDPHTGQLTVSFEKSPELPIETVDLRLFDGPQALLVSPPTCGVHTTTVRLTPWSTPEGQDVNRVDSFETARAPSGPCPAAAAEALNAPAFAAGTVSLRAGAYSPFVVSIARDDGSQRLAAAEVTLPPGLSANLAGVAECSDAEIALARARDDPGDGARERAAPSCPAASEVGAVSIAAGAGIAPLPIQGHAYLAGPYKGAPLSLAAIVPAVAGPFDLGAIVVRAALHVDPQTAQITLRSDAFPQILDGIPLNLRSVFVRLDRPRFVRSPTNCEATTIRGEARSALGQVASLSERFQVGDCRRLRFEPRISLALLGAPRRNGHPRVTAVLRPRPGDANLRGVTIALPRGELLEQGHLRGVCAREAFAAGRCPADSSYGSVAVWSPLLARPLRGRLFLREGARRLPDLAVDLKGRFHLELAGHLDARRARVRASFDRLPDIPISRLELRLRGGSRGLVVNSEGLCAKEKRAAASFVAQDNDSHQIHPRIRASCAAKGR